MNRLNGVVVIRLRLKRLNKMEQGIAGGGSGEFYALHTTITVTPAENENDVPTFTCSSVELREDGLPMWLIIDNMPMQDGTTSARVEILTGYNNENFYYYEHGLVINRSTGEVGPRTSSDDDLRPQKNKKGEP